MNPAVAHGSWALLAAGLLAVAVLLGTSGGPARRPSGAPGSRGYAARDVIAAGEAPRAGPPWPGAGSRAPVVVALVTGTVLVAGLPLTRVAMVAIVLTAAAAGLALHRQVRRRAAENATRGEVVLLAEALLAELRAGQPLATALQRASLRHPLLAPAASVAHLGGHVPTALAEAGGRPGAEGLRRLSAAWELCSGTGSGLVFGLEQVLGTARSDLAVHRQVSAELASARATARLVAALPLLVLLASQSLGGDPWRFLLATPVGLGCLAGGLALIALGLAWIEGIARRAAAGEL